MSPPALKQLKALPRSDAKRILDALEQVADTHPQRMGYVTELVGQPGMWRVRKGNYRAVYEIAGTVMTIVSVTPRKDAYK